MSDASPDHLRPLRDEGFHLFGICGRGLAPLSVVARHLGAEVSGCDRGGTPQIMNYLQTQHMPFATEHSAQHLAPGTTLVATSVARHDVPEIRAAADAGVLWHRTDLLAHVLRARPGAGITGSHGKGTVVALTASALEAAGLDPLALVGVLVPSFGGMTRLGDGPTVAEVDDSDLSLRGVDTDVAVVTNLDDDHPHLDTTLAQAVTAVGEYVARARQRVVLGPSPRADTIEASATAEVWRQGRDFTARTVSVDGPRTVVDLHGPGGERVRTELGLISPKIASNAAVAFATALALGAQAEAAAEGLGRLTSLYRRLEPVGTRDGVRVYDDFGGKHPVAVREGIAQLRRHFPAARITAVFEPFGPYLARWGRRYARALERADRVVLVPPVFLADYGAGAAFDSTWTSAMSSPVHAVDQTDAVERALESARRGDIVVFFAQANASRAMAMAALGEGTAPA